MFIRAERATSVVLAIYAALVASLLALLPFWLDEVLQLVGTRPGLTAAQTFQYVPQNPGGVPLGYLIQHWVLELAGLSRWTARLSAAVFGIATCAAVGALAARAGLRIRWVAVVLFAMLPLVLRYSTEGRPYSLALFLSVAATILFLQLERQYSSFGFVIYLMLLVAGIYTQPFTILTGAGHVLWAMWERRWRLAFAAGAAVSMAILSFVPWLFYARAAWRSTIVANQFQFVWTARTPLMILREFSGAGYWGSGLLALLAVIGYHSNQLRSEQKRLLMCIIAATLTGGLAADALFGYFIAIRQFLWMIPAIAVLGAAGVLALPLRCGLLMSAALFAICAYKSLMFYSEPREDWAAASDALRSQLDGSDCFVVSPQEWRFLYEFFHPELGSRVCGPAHRDRTVVAVITPYTPEPERKRTVDQFAASGYRISASREVGRSQILVFARAR